MASRFGPAGHADGARQEPEGRPWRRGTLLMLAVVWATFWSQFAWVRATNFEGFDEWLLLSLTSRGIVAAPHANRPLQWVWHLPASLAAPHSLEAAYLLHGSYMALAGCLVCLLVRRVVPGQPLLALLSGTLSICWAPLDALRLTTVYTLSHAGSTFGMLLAVVLLVESLARGSRLLLGGGLVVAYVTARGYEAVLPVLAVAPALLPLVAGTSRRRLGVWAAAWWSVIGLAAAQSMLPLLGGPDASLYQLSIKPLDPNPLRFALGLATQFRQHLAPLVSIPPLSWGSAGSAALFLGLAFLALRRAQDLRSVARPRLALVLAGGLAAAGFGYAALVLGTITDPGRAQFLSGPGIGVALAAAVLLLASALPRRLRRPGALLLAAWVVALGTAYTLRKQAFWDARGYYHQQRQVLAGIVTQAPDLSPHTLVMLLDDSGSWRATFGFRHAIEFLYDAKATGYVWGAPDFFYPLAVVPQGFRCEPWPVVREPWGSRVTLHAYSETLVFHADRAGNVRLLDVWPDARLPPLPPGTAYAPAARLRPLTGPPPGARRLIAPRG